MKTAPATSAHPFNSELENERTELVRRLEDGDHKIAQATRDGKDVSRLETLWIRLLRDYEATCDAIARGEKTSLPEAA